MKRHTLQYLFTGALLLSAFVHKGKASDCFTHSPGDQMWLMVNDIGNLTKPIVGCVTSITPAEVNTGAPYNITVPGNYRLTGDVEVTAAGQAFGITISTSNVYLDLNNFTISMNGDPANCIYIFGGVSNIVVANGVITGTNVSNGVNVEAPGNSDIFIKNILCDMSLTAVPSSVGVRIYDVKRVTLDSVVTIGQYVRGEDTSTGSGITFIGADAEGLNDTIYVRNCQCYNNVIGIELNVTSNCLVENCFLSTNSYGIRSAESLINCTIEGCDIVDSGTSGIEINYQDTLGTYNVVINDCSMMRSAGPGLDLIGTGTIPINLTVTNSSFINNARTGINAVTFGQGVTGLIENCIFRYNGFRAGSDGLLPPSGTGLGAGINIYQSLGVLIIANNQLSSNAGGGIILQAVDSGAAINVIDNVATFNQNVNYLDNSAAPKISLWTGNSAFGFITVPNYVGPGFALGNTPTTYTTSGAAPVKTSLTRWANIGVSP